ncbi:MAG TPA: hypothetical protein VKE96_13360 [Vicinamibacterales bacterium]|nr:hypothetical protein [Vicinamibacterales bacterium]
MRWFAAIAVLSLLGVPLLAQKPLPDQEAFLQEVRKHLDTDEYRQTGYMYTETRRMQKLDKSGNATGESVTVLESYPGLPGEERWERVLSEDGKAIPPPELERRDRERQKHVEEYARKLARDPAQTKAKEDRERERRRRELSESIDDIVRVFDIRIVGREAIEGHDAIVLTLTPRRDAKPRTRAGGIMRNFNVRAWISESDYELVRLDAEAIDTVSFGLGMLARVHKGSRASFQRRKVNGELWLPALATYTVSVRVGLVAVLRRGGTVEFSNYKKFGVDSSYRIATPDGR